MKAKLLPYRSVTDYGVWHLAGRLLLLAGILIAYSYCFLLAVNSIAKVLK